MNILKYIKYVFRDLKKHTWNIDMSPLWSERKACFPGSCVWILGPWCCWCFRGYGTPREQGHTGRRGSLRHGPSSLQWLCFLHYLFPWAAARHSFTELYHLPATIGYSSRNREPNGPLMSCFLSVLFGCSTGVRKSNSSNVHSGERTRWHWPMCKFPRVSL